MHPKSKMYVVLKPANNIQAFEYYTCSVVYFSNLLVSKVLIFSITVGYLWCGYSDDIQITSPFSCGLYIYIALSIPIYDVWFKSTREM